MNINEDYGSGCRNFIATIFLALALVGCGGGGGDDGGGGGGGASIPAVNGDGIAEMTAAPVFNPTSVLSSVSSVAVNVSVDSDTAYFGVLITADGGNTSNGLLVQATSSTGTAHTETITVPIAIPLVAGTPYNAYVITCTSAQAVSCASLAAGTGYGESSTAPGTYARVDMANQTSETQTGVSLAVLTVTAAGGGGGITFVNGDGIAEMTAAPVFNPTSVLSSASSVAVNVSVDSDTASFNVLISDGFNIIGQLVQATSSTGTAHTETISVPITIPLVAGTPYYAFVITCTSAQAASCASQTVGTGYGPSSTAPGTYAIYDMATSSTIPTSETGVSLAVLTVQ